jgi:hypothetical protein
MSKRGVSDPQGQRHGAGCGERGRTGVQRTGDPNTGSFNDATVLKTFGDIPENLDEL